MFDILDNLGFVSLFFLGVAILFFIFASISRKQGDQGTDSTQITIAIICLALSLLTFLAMFASRNIHKDDSSLLQPLKNFINYIT